MSALPGDARPKKRARRTRRQEDQGLIRQQDEEFWREDGTVILYAGGLKLKVNGGVLSDHSPVLARMLEHVQRTDPPSRDLYPVLKLEDSVEDIKHILRLLFSRQNIFPDKPPTFDQVSAYVRMAHKYGMQTVLEQWMAYLKGHFTTDFHVWKAHTRLVPEGFEPIHTIGVVNLARLTGETTILPTALLICSIVDGIVHGFKRSDGVQETLSADDLERCFHARGSIIQYNAMATYLTLIYHSDHPCTPLCEGEAKTLAMSYKANWRVAQFAPRALGPSRWGDFEVRFDHLGICSRCREGMKDTYFAEHESIWRRLPKIVDVEVEGWLK